MIYLCVCVCVHCSAATTAFIINYLYWLRSLCVLPAASFDALMLLHSFYMTGILRLLDSTFSATLEETQSKKS